MRRRAFFASSVFRLIEAPWPGAVEDDKERAEPAQKCCCGGINQPEQPECDTAVFGVIEQPVTVGQVDGDLSYLHKFRLPSDSAKKGV